MSGALFKEMMRNRGQRTAPHLEKRYCGRLIMTQPEFTAQILQHGGTLNIVTSHSLVVCSFGNTFSLERRCLKANQSPGNLGMKQESVLR